MTELHTSHEVESPAPPMVLYLGIGGVLQPSVSTYTWVHGCDPFDDGHAPYECAPLLEQLLSGWPDVRIVLTSTRPWAHGLDEVLAALGPALASRIAGYTFKDLTERAKVGERFPRCLSEMDYWRLSKSQVVEKHVRWLQPSRWVAVDDETYGWSDYELACHVALTPPLKGLLDADARAKLYGVLVHQLGPPENVAAPSAANDIPGELPGRLFDPALAHQFTLAATDQVSRKARASPRVLLLGLEETLFTTVRGAPVARPFLFGFLDSCAELFERLVVMPDDIEQYRAIANELGRQGAVPPWFAELDCIAWNGRQKDLERVGVLELRGALAVDANRQHIVPGQEAQWINVSAFDGRLSDHGLLTAYERLRALVAGAGGRGDSG